MSRTNDIRPARVYDRPKNRVAVYEHHVEKTPKVGRESDHRARLEQDALSRLEGVRGTPQIIQTTGRAGPLVLTRVPGTPLDEAREIPDQFFASLGALVHELFRRGVARAVKSSDVLIGPDGQAGLVDFERVALRRGPWDCRWFAARLLSHLALLELVSERAPHLLSRTETIVWALAARVVDAFRAPRGRVSRTIRRRMLALFDTQE